MYWDAGRRWHRLESRMMHDAESGVSKRSARARLILVAIALLLVWAMQTAAKAFLPVILRDHPLLLVMLDARTRDITLASPKLGVVELITIAVVWRFSVHFLYYVVGRWYGAAALRLIQQRFRLFNNFANRIERLFERWSIPTVFLLSNKILCVLAGSSGMQPIIFGVAHFAGTLLRVVALCLILRSNRDALKPIVGRMDENANWLTMVFVIATAIVLGASIYLRYRGTPRSTEHDSDSGST